MRQPAIQRMEKTSISLPPGLRAALERKVRDRHLVGWKLSDEIRVRLAKAVGYEDPSTCPQSDSPDER